MGCCSSKEVDEVKTPGDIGFTDNKRFDDNRPPTPTPDPPQSDVKVYIALYDYDARTDEDLSFRKGDYLEVKPENSEYDWWMATSRSSGKTGYIPNNYVAEVKSLEAEE